MNDLKPEGPEPGTGCSWQAVFANDSVDCVLPAGHNGKHDYSVPEIPDHQCTYPPDGHLGTGRCMTCGQPAPDPIITYLRDAAEHFIRPRLPLMAAELEDFTGRLAAALSTAEVAS